MLRCKTEEIILHGEITGIVTDTATSQPLQAIPVKLKPVNNTTSTSTDGKYLFKSLIPGDYTVEASKPPYAKSVRSTTVNSANTTEVNFALHKIQYPEISHRHLDFGFDSTLKSFTIRNTGTGKLNYSLLPSQDWISVNPNIGEATTEIDTFNVTINRTGLSENKHIESIEVVSHVGLDLIRDTISVLINGVMDQDTNYYGVVTIGTQTWLAENLNTGIHINTSAQQTENGEIEKYCYENAIGNCQAFGGLYQWDEMMQYNPSDTGDIGTTQGVCPVGWHLPTYQEFWDLVGFLGGQQLCIAKLLQQGNWVHETGSATNESGFTALPAGKWEPPAFVEIGFSATFWTSTLGYYWTPYSLEISYWPAFEYALGATKQRGYSVRCIKDPPKNK